MRRARRIELALYALIATVGADIVARALIARGYAKALGVAAESVEALKQWFAEED